MSSIQTLVVLGLDISSTFQQNFDPVQIYCLGSKMQRFPSFVIHCGDTASLCSQHLDSCSNPKVAVADTMQCRAAGLVLDAQIKISTSQ